MFGSTANDIKNVIDGSALESPNVTTNPGTETYQRIPLYRFARNDNPSHFFTATESEKDSVVQNLSNVFVLEGPSHYVVANYTLNSKPVYRMYNSISGAHFYTASEAERDNVLASMDWFSLEGIAFYVFLSPEPGTVPVYRFYVPETGSHYFTIDEAEKNQLTSSGQTVKQYDGIAYYAYATDGLIQEIRDLIPDEIMTEMKSLGLSIHVGDNPPSIENTYKCSPMLLSNTNREGDREIGTRFVDIDLQFSNQDNENMKISVFYKEATWTGGGRGGLIVGEDNRFTVFLNTTYITGNGHESSMLEVWSGIVTPTHIEGLERGLFMLDDKGDPNNELIENGEGRTFKDGDGVSPKTGISISSKALVQEYLPAAYAK